MQIKLKNKLWLCLGLTGLTATSISFAADDADLPSSGLWNNLVSQLTQASTAIVDTMQTYPIPMLATAISTVVVGYATYRYIQRQRIFAEQRAVAQWRLNEQLIAAIVSNNQVAVAELLSAGAEVNCNNGKHDNRFILSPLLVAIQNGLSTIVAQLLAAGAKVDTRAKFGAEGYGKGQTALMCAIIYRQPEIVAQLLAAGADINVKDELDQTALWLAYHNEDQDIAVQLLVAGADTQGYPRDSFMLAVAEKAFFAGMSFSAQHRLKALTHSQLTNLIATSITDTISVADFFDNYHDLNALPKFSVQPGQELFPDGPIAAGISGATGETEPEYFNFLDLAILGCQSALVDQLLMAGMDPANLTLQTREWLAQFDLPASGAVDAKHVNTAAEQIAHMVYYANMANTAEVQQRISGLTGSFKPELLPAPVIRYAQAFKAYMKKKAIYDRIAKL